jgi:hypothetical protein
MSAATTSWWPDRRPLPSRRATLLAVAGGLALFLSPVVVDLAGGATWRDLWFLTTTALVFLVQTAMDVARPRPGDRTAVVVYRATYFGVPLLLIVSSAAVIWPT